MANRTSSGSTEDDWYECATAPLDERLGAGSLILYRLEIDAAGGFGAAMAVELVNDGPFTIWLDSDDRA